MTTLARRRSAVAAMYAGLLLTVLASIAPFVDRATANMLADHIRSGYPAYGDGRIDEAVTLWLVYLATLGALGVASWIGTIWAVRAGKPWARWATTGAFALATCIALFNLLVRDTSGDTGLPPLLGTIGLIPCLAGLTAVTLLWRRS